MDEKDALQLEGYTLYVDKLFENQQINDRLNRLNFSNPISKIDGVDFELDEIEFNRKQGIKGLHKAKINSS
ncbi:exodeoxyribonuclease 7 large subunit [Acrasis kona]|uniref:Exodeoxyribonuclease 7 large subunit n=1 Tax=Acrasis kona TaxID=1008807 RepID=A0AAW2Z172_9EUKA